MTANTPIPPSVAHFGLLIVGNEILDGRRSDFHFADTLRQLQARALLLGYALVLPDRADLLTAQLSWAFAQREPFFCCGGIGGTPDDLTRQCAARAGEALLVRHPEGEAILRRRFGAETTPARLRMIEFPEGATLIPNPVNQVPGFQFRNGYFVPGFPQMASPMRDWVLDHAFSPGTARLSAALKLPDAREADLVDIMEAFIARHPTLSFSSLPHLAPSGNVIELGLSGTPEAVRMGLADLRNALRRRKICFEET